jgi:hypothetical protein
MKNHGLMAAYSGNCIAWQLSQVGRVVESEKWERAFMFVSDG